MNFNSQISHRKSQLVLIPFLGLVVGSFIAWNIPGLCYYNKDVNKYKRVYGTLYNWYTVEHSRNIAPAGWHVPTDAEWSILTDYLEGETFAGAKMKEAGKAHWQTPNTGAGNQSGLTLLP
jgi:uncharacterized protein (TIGR02145 family)